MNIKDFITDSHAICTKNIQAAVDKLKEEGGGTLVFPAGLYISGSIELRSNICLYFESGSILKASSDINDFPYIGFRHNELGETKSLLWAIDCENITLCGNGTIDLSDEAYCNFDDIVPFDIDLNTLSPRQKSECVVNRKSSINETLNLPLFFESCTNISVTGIKIMHSPVWTLTFSRCEGVTIRGITIDNRRIVGNSDGIHLSATRNAVISGCNIKAGDDCVAVTCITAHDKISENIIISDCNFESSSAGIRLGHMNAKVKNVCISNINISDSNRGIAIFAHNSGHVENVRISGVNIVTRIQCGGWWGKGEPLIICAAQSDGVIEKVAVSDIFAQSDNGIVIAGKDNNIHDVTIKDFTLDLTDSENRKIFSSHIDLRPNEYRHLSDGELFEKYVTEASVNFVNFICNNYIQRIN